jgi:hypothetical protein
MEYYSPGSVSTTSNSFSSEEAEELPNSPESITNSRSNSPVQPVENLIQESPRVSPIRRDISESPRPLFFTEQEMIDESQDMGMGITNQVTLEQRRREREQRLINRDNQIRNDFIQRNISRTNELGGFIASNALAARSNIQVEIKNYSFVTERFERLNYSVRTAGNFKAVLGGDGIRVSELDDFIESEPISAPNGDEILSFEMTVIRGIPILWMVTNQEIILYNTETFNHRVLSLPSSYVSGYSDRAVCVSSNRNTKVSEIVIGDLDFNDVLVSEYILPYPIINVSINQYKIQVLTTRLFYYKGLARNEDLISINQIRINSISDSFAIIDRNISYIAGRTLMTHIELPFRPLMVMSDIATGYIDGVHYMCNLQNGDLIEVDDHYENIVLCDDGTILVLDSYMLFRYMPRPNSM